MNRNRRIALCLLWIVLLMATAALSQSAAGKNPLQGVWKVTEITTTGPNAATNKTPQPGFIIFTAGYYSMSTVNTDKPRADLPTDINTASAAQLRDAWGPFTGQSGTYEIKGSEVTRHPLASKTPAVMKSGNFSTDMFKIEGKTLTLVGKANQAGPVTNPNTIKLTRVE